MSERNLYTALAALVLCLPSCAAAAEAEHIPSITVTGRGEADARPDLAHVSVGVVAQAKTAADALAQNNAAMQRLMDALKARGIEPRDVQTSSFNVFPQYPHDDQGRQIPKISGYQVSNEVRIRVRQIDRLGAVLDQLVQEGANQVHGVGFEIAEPTALQDSARTRAMEDARRKAELLARVAGVRLGQPLSIQEGQGSFPAPMPMYRMAAQESSVPIASGELTVEAQVTVSYAIEGEEPKTP